LGGSVDHIITSRPAAPALAAVPKVGDKFSAGTFGTDYYKDGPLFRVVLSDGRTVVADSFRETSTGWQAKAGELWYRGER